MFYFSLDNKILNLTKNKGSFEEWKKSTDDINSEATSSENNSNETVMFFYLN